MPYSSDDKLQLEDVQNRFTYHPPKDGQPLRYTQIRAEALTFARLIIESCPQSRERASALSHLDEVVFFANAAIARNE